jgi:hypothetical protein
MTEHIFPTRWKLALFAGGLFALIAAAFFASRTPPLVFDSSMLPEAELRARGLAFAQFSGLVGDSTSEQGVLVTRGSWETMMGSYSSPQLVSEAMRREPVYLYQVTGDIPIVRMFGHSGVPANSAIGFTYAIDPDTGNVMGGQTTLRGHAMPSLDQIPADRGALVLDVPQPFDQIGQPTQLIPEATAETQE